MQRTKSGEREAQEQPQGRRRSVRVEGSVERGLWRQASLLLLLRLVRLTQWARWLSRRTQVVAVTAMMTLMMQSTASSAQVRLHERAGSSSLFVSSALEDSLQRPALQERSHHQEQADQTAGVEQREGLQEQGRKRQRQHLQWPVWRLGTEEAFALKRQPPSLQEVWWLAPSALLLACLLAQQRSSDLQVR